MVIFTTKFGDLEFPALFSFLIFAIKMCVKLKFCKCKIAENPFEILRTKKCGKIQLKFYEQKSAEKGKLKIFKY